MRFQQLNEQLAYVSKCRLEMAKLYRRLHGGVDSSRVKLMLEYLQQHQKEVSEKIDNYIEEAPTRLLELWYNDIVFEDFVKRCQDLVVKANMDEDDLLELHLDLDNRLIGLLQKTAESSVPGDVKNALNDLVRVEKIQQQRLVHNSIRMEDI
ncbi:hypothetical protein K0I73_03100 [Shewanella mesophila]|uniref:hypothetical protein n=1 Tax=Shewanella mesophila TaxID=2864208 RepID=UPI001C658005|nr:hypothetical protein [Shewanella mesophila]QYJ86751.1 hypothetical protein K0I73_03100 [Shewanella mesophila]